MLFAGLFGLLVLTGCAVNSGRTQEADCIVTAWQTGNLEPVPPQLYAFLEPEQSVRAIARHMSFTVFDEDGNIVGAMLSDSLHPSALLYRDFYSATLQLSHGQNLGMKFTCGYPLSSYPHIVSVTRWRLEDADGSGLYLPAGCWYHGGEAIDFMTPEDWTPEILAEMITVLDDGFDYIYVVQPNWREGQVRWHSIFAFRVNSGINT